MRLVRALSAWLHPRPLTLAALQLLGIVCVFVAAWNIADGWHALGLVGLALLGLGEFVHRFDQLPTAKPDPPQGRSPCPPCPPN